MGYLDFADGYCRLRAKGWGFEPRRSPHFSFNYFGDTMGAALVLLEETMAHSLRVSSTVKKVSA